MNYELVNFRIYGLRPLLQNRYFDIDEPEADPDKVMVRKKQTLTGHALAVKQLYTTDGGKTFYHPGIAFWRSLFTGMTGKQIAGKAVTTVVSVAVSHVEDEFLLLDPETLDAKRPKPLTAKRWVVDKRTVVNSNKKPPARIPAFRPKWTKWGGILTLECDMDVFKSRQTLGVLAEVLCIAGRYGVGAGRIRELGKGVWGGLGLGKFRAELIG